MIRLRNIRYINGLIILSVVFIVFMFLSHSAKVFSVDKNSRVIVSSSYQSARGSMIKLDVYVKDIDDMAGGFIEIKYDQDVLRIRDELIYGNVLDDFMTANNIMQQNGSIRVAWANTKGFSGEGVLFSIPFRLNIQNGESDIKVKTLELYNAEGETVDVKSLDGRVGSFSGYKMDRLDNMDRNQVWNIKFSGSLYPSSVDERSVKIINKRTGDLVRIQVELKDKNLIEIKPKTHYGDGEFYLIVTRKVMCLRGDFLSSPVRIEFSVE